MSAIWANAHTDLWPEKHLDALDRGEMRLVSGCSLVGPVQCQMKDYNHDCYEPYRAVLSLVRLGILRAEVVEGALPA